MAKQFYRQQQQQQPPFHEEEPQDSNKYGIKVGWLIIPLVLVALYVFGKSISPAPELSWENIMDFLHVTHENRERFTMMTIFMLVLILVAAIWRILRNDSDH
jgi:hypothetical protein